MKKFLLGLLGVVIALVAAALVVPSFLDWCPDDLQGDLLTYGTLSWPTAKSILGFT